MVPSGVELDLLRVLQPDLAPIAEAERAGVLTMRRDVIAFRHELARRTVAARCRPACGCGCTRDVLDALLAQRRPDPFRVLHHAVQAGDDVAVVDYGQIAARAAAGPAPIARRPPATPRSCTQRPAVGRRAGRPGRGIRVGAVQQQPAPGRRGRGRHGGRAVAAGRPGPSSSAPWPPCPASSG